uniref:sensor histidine kinase n=1 Tax=Streptomyces sp. NRRL S-1896 TaxID=1463893 RepID=UPI0004CCB34A
QAERLTTQALPVSAATAVRLGLVDRLGEGAPGGFPGAGGRLAALAGPAPEWAGRGIREVTGLVNDLIELARDEEPLPLLEEVRIAELGEHAVATAPTHWPRVPFSLDIGPGAAAATRPGVPARLARLLTNLLDNAAKFSPPDAPVEVGLTTYGGGLELTVRDHGPGIAAEDLPYVFDRFY